jgi:hypothetical protein
MGQRKSAEPLYGDPALWDVSAIFGESQTSSSGPQRWSSAGLGRTKYCNSWGKIIMQGRKVTSPARLAGSPLRHQNDCDFGGSTIVAISGRLWPGRIIEIRRYWPPRTARMFSGMCNFRGRNFFDSHRTGHLAGLRRLGRHSLKTDARSGTKNIAKYF